MLVRNLHAKVRMLDHTLHALHSVPEGLEPTQKSDKLTIA